MITEFRASTLVGAGSLLPAGSRINFDCTLEMTMDSSLESKSPLPRGRARLGLSLQILLISFFLFSDVCGQGVSVGKKAKDNSVEAQLAAFRLHEDFEVNLFADEKLGIANPVAMHWDKRGRLWVLTTLTYAQLEPGEMPNDTLVILEDTDKDGRADKSTVFADGFDMPMGFALSDEGVYLGEGPDLLLLRDTNGDDRADTREVLLTGFGTGDTHQNISNFTWGPDCKLYFSQGLHCYSRVETPWGIVRGDTAGFWRFDPGTLKLEPFCFPSLCTQNPCGIAFDKTGALFIKSNNKELIFATPGLIPTTHQKNLVPVGNVGATPGKSMGGEYVDSPHLPDWIQNNILIVGYYSNRVSAFPLVPEGSGYAKVEPVEVMVSDHGSFRPVEVRIGPDGAIYVADWFNPIIGHYQASLRHPDRDEEHGRVWRVTARGRELQKPNQWPQTYHLDSSDVEDKIPFRMWNPKMAERMEGHDPRQRLDLIVSAANSASPQALPVALAALDYPRDRFIDYALEQTVHALAPGALSGIESGDLKFEKPEHLAYFLETFGGNRALDIARERLKDAELSREARVSLSKVLARNGTPEDLLFLLRENPEIEILNELARIASIRKTKPADGFAPLLVAISESGNVLHRVAAFRMGGAWDVKGVSEPARKVFESAWMEDSFRAEAAKAFAKLNGKGAVEPLLSGFADTPTLTRSAIVEALVPIAPIAVADEVATSFEKGDLAKIAEPLLRPFLNRQGASQHLLSALKKTPPEKEAAAHIVSALSAMGAKEDALLAFLQDTMGIDSGARAHSPEFVAKLVDEVAKGGDAVVGKSIYNRAELTCIACHQIGGQGGIIGPSLDTVGAGLSPDLLVESVLWPQRQLKEGYFSITVHTKGGDVFAGYREGEADGMFRLREMATGAVKEFPRKEITRIENTGSLMPEGLTNGLSREELRDLVAYLASLRG